MSEEEEKKKSDKVEDKDNDTDSDSLRMYALLSYLGPLILVPFLNAKDDPFVKFHLKQGLLIAIGWVVLTFLMYFPMVIFTFYLIIQLGALFLMVLSVIGIMNVLNGDRKGLPLVGDIADRFNI